MCCLAHVRGAPLLHRMQASRDYGWEGEARPNTPSTLRASEAIFHIHGICLITRLSRLRTAEAQRAGGRRGGIVV